MSPYRAALLALFVVGGVLVVAPASATTGDAVAATSERVGATSSTLFAANSTANNSSLGADISSFMQSSAAEVGGAVETGMWTAAFNATDNKSVQAELVERRTSELRKELTALQQEKQELVARRESGDISDTVYKARVSRLVGQISALKSAIGATESRASAANVEATELMDLRTQTDNLTGPEISSVAKNVTGVGIGNGLSNGNPPDHAGDGNGAKTKNGNGNNDGIGSERGATERGPPSDVGSANATANESQRGPPDAAKENPVVEDGSSSAATTGAAGKVESGTPGEVGNGTPGEVGNGTPAAGPVTVNNSTAVLGNGTTPTTTETLVGFAATTVELFDPVSSGLSVGV